MLLHSLSDNAMFHQCLQHGTDKKHWSPALVIFWHNLMLVSYTGLWSSYTRAKVLLLSEHLNNTIFKKTIGHINRPTKKKKKGMLKLEENIAGSQKAAQSTSHRLSRSQVVLTKRLFKVLSELELSALEFLSCVTIWVCVL